MKLACADDTFRLFDHEHIVELVRMLGVDGIDLCLMEQRSSLRLAEVRADPAGWAGRVDERVRGRGLEVADVFVIPWTDFRTMAPNHPDASQRSAAMSLFEDVLEFAVRLRSPGITILPGIEWEGETPDQSLERAAQELARRVDAARSRGVRLSIEPHLGSVVATPARALALLERVPGLEVTLDYSHFVYQGISEREADSLAPFARHCHVRGARLGRMQASVRESTVDVEAMLDALTAAGYQGYLGLEYVWLDWEHCNECDNLAETILLRDRLRAKLSGETWSYPEMAV
jgi:sugar phosphate isomerase/epimerase